MNICDFLRTGKENAITRNELVTLLGLPDRTVRKLIQEARDRGEVILNAQDGAGYYMSNDVGELERQYRTNRNRALSILRQQKHIRRALAENCGQVTFEDAGRLLAGDAQLTLDILEAEKGECYHATD